MVALKQLTSSFFKNKKTKVEKKMTKLKEIETELVEELREIA